MRKLNEVFAKNKSSKTRLANDNFNIEHEFKQKLKELENESIKLENQISQLKEEKADILAEIVEAERQILLWERKIQLEKEMQEEVDPTIGQSEIVAMRKEIHRMELMYDQLRKKQEEMIKNMERAVFKKETIQLKYQPKVEKKNAEDKSSKGKLSRQIANLKQTLRHTTDNTMQLDTTIEQRKREIDDISGDINAERDQRENTEKEVKRFQFDILANRLSQAKANWRVASLENMANKYDQVATNRFQHEVQEAQVRAVLDHQMQQNAAVDSLAQRLRAENPLFDQIFSNLTEW
jgi:chromosome segregation ATPase